MQKETESQIVTAICDYLAIRERQGRLFYWRANNMAVVKSDGTFRSMPKHSKNGVPDVLVVRDGWFIGLEVKTRTGKQSEAQKIFERDLMDKGNGEYHLVRSVDDVQELGL